MLLRSAHLWGLSGQVSDLVEDLRAGSQSLQDRGTVLLRPPQGKNTVSVDLPDSFFELTEVELRAMLARQKQHAEQSSVLMTKRLREQQASKNTLKYDVCIIRVRLPGGYIAQARFKPLERCRRVVDWLRMLQTVPARNFVLLGPAGCSVNTSLSLQQQQFVPAAVFTLLWTEDEPTLPFSLKSEMQEYVQEFVPAEAPKSVQPLAPSSTSGSSGQSSSQRGGHKLGGGAVLTPAEARARALAAAEARAGGGSKGGNSKPAWMKLGK